MGHTSFSEKRLRPLLCSVDELIGHHHVSRPYRGLEGANGGNGNQPAHTKRTHRPKIGPVGHFAGQKLMMASMASQKNGFDAL
jgi:hypothetical protein